MVRIHSVESLATLDGDGVRYAIFFTQCPLRCVYCHNPDTWYECGKEYTINELINKVARMKPYFGEDGGVTFSGGEPLLNAKAINDLNNELVKNNIKYDLDTCGCVDLTNEIKTAVSNSDLVILDLKFWDKDSYLKYTTGDYDRVIRFARYLKDINKRTWIRTVIVPGINDEESVLKKYVKIVKELNFVEKYELLGFHTMGFYKYENLGIKNPLKDVKEMDNSRLQQLQQYVDKEIKK